MDLIFIPIILASLLGLYFWIDWWYHIAKKYRIKIRKYDLLGKYTSVYTPQYRTIFGYWHNYYYGDSVEDITKGRDNQLVYFVDIDKAKNFIKENIKSHKEKKITYDYGINYELYG